MSGKYPDLLRRRAESMMGLAERLLSEGEYDLAVLNAGYAAQLYIKSVLLRLTGEEWKGHGIRTLLGAVALAAQERGLRDVAEEIIDFTRRNRRMLAELEEAHTRSVYGAFEYSEGQAEAIIELAKSTIQLMKGIEDRVFRGAANEIANGATLLRALIGWRRHVGIVSEAVKVVAPEARVYVAGGAAENRLTVESDIDVLVVLPHEVNFEEAVELRARILEEAERLKMPLYAPVELHIISGEELKEYARKGKVIPADEI